MFCSCSAAYAGADPNTHVCPVCMALPGTLPVMNRQAVEYALLTGMALNCEHPEASKFDRKLLAASHQRIAAFFQQTLVTAP